MRQLGIWRRMNGIQVSAPIEKEIEKTIARETSMGHLLNLCIGTDSQVKAGRVDFVTVIVVLRKRSGAFMYVRSEALKMRMSVKERMLAEVQRSIDVAYAISDVVSTYNVDLEVHADINTNALFKSHDAFREAMGYVTGMGFTFKAKPHAFASSCCADKML